jgi:hypothetical protein
MKNSAFKQALPSEDHVVASNDEPGNNVAYDEYLRGFDEIPVLQDAVRIPPARAPQPDFRRGERRDARSELRPDAYAIREANAAALELLYGEYSQPAPVPVPEPALATTRPKRKKAQKRKSKKALARTPPLPE